MNPTLVPPDPSGPVVRCFNVKFSPNLGDGLLSECLELALLDHGAKESSSIDLAAREAYGDAMFGRSAALKLLDGMPAAVRQQAIRLPLAVQAARKWRPHYATGLGGADAVVVGGGNLISDLDLNFPTKLPLAIEEAEKRKLPIAIYACGVGSRWSRTGLRWLRTAFSSPQLRAVYVRDHQSKALWDEQMRVATGHEAQVVRDPGLLASRYYPAPPRPAGRRPVVGIGIMSHIAIRYHSDREVKEAALRQWYVDVARGMLAEGYKVSIFTNGSPEDVAYLLTIEASLRGLGDQEDLEILTQTTPRGLCAHIASFNALIAFRMHAVIAAYSYRVPAVALAWDHKLDAFMASVGRQDCIRDVAATHPAECVALAVEIAKSGIPKDSHGRVISEAYSDVGKLYSVLRENLTT